MELISLFVYFCFADPPKIVFDNIPPVSPLVSLTNGDVVGLISFIFEVFKLSTWPSEGVGDIAACVGFAFVVEASSSAAAAAAFPPNTIFWFYTFKKKDEREENEEE